VGTSALRGSIQETRHAKARHRGAPLIGVSSRVVRGPMIADTARTSHPALVSAEQITDCSREATSIARVASYFLGVRARGGSSFAGRRFRQRRAQLAISPDRGLFAPTGVRRMRRSSARHPLRLRRHRISQCAVLIGNALCLSKGEPSTNDGRLQPSRGHSS
jgi:hypothetical protein